MIGIILLVCFIQEVISSDLSKPIGCSSITCPPDYKCVQDKWECVKAPCPQPIPMCTPITTTRPPCTTCPPGKQCYTGGFGPIGPGDKPCPTCVKSKPKDETCEGKTCACDERCEIVMLCEDTYCYGYCYNTTYCVKNEGKSTTLPPSKGGK